MGLPSFETLGYINWYFSEVTRLRPNQLRSFRIFKDNESFSEPILPLYENCTQTYVFGVNASSGTTFSLVPTNDSTLPPLINAMEVFEIGNELTNGTDTKDVQGLASLQKAFAVLQDWRGDPCLPAPYTWDWIDCNNDSTPRVTTLFLGNFNLSGMLPDFSSMDALQIIDIHNNSLGGPIPDFLGTLPHLETLNLANNHFNGSVPASLLNKNGLNLVVTGNPDLCASGASCLGTSDSTRNPSARSSGSTNNVRTMFGTLIPSIIILHVWRKKH
ncbi:hypothetical protein BUALT_Bualt13G0084200 [Buddleja alternifolia]|uniref:Malectin-like domain-containing protein n=1 Tax=Buddleja alternifolia TaxID=168488 RepID=A0AAV6WU87_9LAMI|nr:hypothetical protein BUALT_Bualt13G0084200 [Buddleja alternifolia]